MRRALHDPAARTLLIAAALGLFSLGAVQAAYGPAFPTLIERFAVGLDRVGDVVVLHFAGAVTATFATSLALPRFGYRRVLMTAAALAAAGLTLVAFAPDWGWLLTGAGLAGVGFGLLNTSFNVLVARVFSPGAAPVLNLLSALFGLGAVIAPASVAALGSLRLPFVVLAVATAAAGVASRGVPVPESAPSPGARRTPWLAALGFALLYAVYVGAESGVASWETVHLEGSVGPRAAALLTSAFWATLTLGRLIAIPIAERFRPRDVVLGASAVSLVLLIATHATPAAPLAYVALGLSFAPIFPTGLAWIERVFPARSERIVPFALGAAGFGPMIVTAWIGRWADASGPMIVPSALSILAGLLLIVVASMWWVTRDD